MITHIINVVYISVYVCALVYAISFICTCFVTGGYFDREFIKLHVPWPSFVSLGFSSRPKRAAFYSFMLLIGQARMKKLISWRSPTYQEQFIKRWLPFNYRQLARPCDWVLCCIFWIAALLFILLIITGIALQLICT